MSFFDYPTAGEEEVRREEEHFLPDCTEEDWRLLLAHTRSCRFGAGQSVIDPPQSERALYIVVDGTLEVQASDQRRARPRRLATLGPGTVIGELSFFDGRPPSARVVAVTEAELARFGLEDLDTLASERPDLARAVLFDLGRLVAGRFRDLQSQASPVLA